MADLPIVNKFFDHDGVTVAYMAATIPGVNVTVSTLPQGSAPTASATVNDDGTITMAIGIPLGPAGVGIESIEFINNVMVITLTDNTTYEFDEIATQLGQMEEATLAAENAADAAGEAATLANQKATAANTAANQATAAKNAANTAASEATDAKTAAEAATSEAQAATTAATNAATAANNAAQTALASVGNMLIGEYEDTQGGQMFTTEDAYATGMLHGLTVYGKSTQVQDPAPTPDAPQEIKSVADGTAFFTGKCIWGGEQMADDIVAAVGNTTYAYKGEDADGKYVAITGNSAVEDKLFFEFPSDGQYTLITRAKRSAASSGMNMKFLYTDGDRTALKINGEGTSTVVNKVYDYANVSLLAKTLVSVKGQCDGSTTYIYYEHSGLFKGNLTVDNFTPYEGDTLHFLPDDIEPLRSLPDGTRDILTIDANGNGVVERNVESFALTQDTGSITYRQATNTGLYTYQITLPQRYKTRGIITYLCDKMSTFNPVSGVANMKNLDKGIAFYHNPIVANSTNTVAYINAQYATLQDFKTFLTDNPILINYPPATPTTETIPAAVMPQIPSEYLNAWLDASDQNGDAIDPAWGMEYERDLTITINNIESAIADIVSA